MEGLSGSICLDLLVFLDSGSKLLDVAFLRLFGLDMLVVGGVLLHDLT